MDPRQRLLVVLAGSLLVALFALSLSVRPRDGTVAPADAGRLQVLERALSRLPGLGRPLQADEVAAAPPSCFDGERFTSGAAPKRCRFTVPDGVDRLALSDVSSRCAVEVEGQDEVPDQDLDATDVGEDGTLRIALGGEGAVVTVRADGAGGRCSARLAS
jgi:hypothetical protein